MVVNSRNVWGNAGGIEAQRGDLWVLDLETVLDAVRRSSFANRLELPSPSSTIQFARSVSFPEGRIGDIEVKALNTPKLYPSFDEPLGSVRVDFLVDSVTTGYNGTSIVKTSKIQRSKIYSLLYGWRILTRVGRLPYNSEDIAIPLPAGPIPVSGVFKKDVKIYFLQGTTKDQSDVDTSLPLGGSSSGLEVSMAFVMKKCWISSLQFNNVDQSSTQPLTLTAAIIPEEIYPFDPTPEIVANIAQRSSAFNRTFIGGLA
jgi:hypothetical protein